MTMPAVTLDSGATPDGFISGEGITPPARPGSVNPAPPVERPRDDNGRFTKEDLEKVRQEEKDKLYKKVSTVEERSKALEDELKILREEREKKQSEEADRLKTIAQEKKAAEEAEMGFKELLKAKEQEWESRFESSERERNQAFAVLERERELSVLSDYRAERLSQEADTIMPELRDLVRGITQEEIESSILDMKNRSEAIVAQAQMFQQQARQQQRGVPVTAPTSGPTDIDSTYESLGADDIRNMSLSEYAKRRDTLLGAARTRIQERGLYG
jgi:hypothetical protein